jgi:TRAP-type C4-dicarboxylate transport system substrate-binding protein
MGDAETSEFGTIVPSFMVSDMIGFFQTIDQAWKAMDGDVGRYIVSEYEQRAKVKILGWLELGGMSGICCNKKLIRSSDDFKGLLVRAPTKTRLLFMEDLGAKPVSMSSAEVYTALQYGTLDAVDTAIDSIVTRKFYQVARNITIGPWTPSHSTGIAMNLDLWNKLSHEDQTAFLECAKFGTEYTRTETAATDAAALKFLKSQQDVQVFEVPAETLNSWRSASYPRQLKLLEELAGKEQAKKLLDLAGQYK